MRIRACLLTLLVLILPACNTERRRLTERLPHLEQEYKDASRRLTARRAALAASEDRIRSLRVDLALQNTETQNYLQQHQIAAACIKADRMNWGGEGQRSGDAARGAKLGGALCSVALLNNFFAQEVAGVTQHLGESEGHARELKERIAGEERALESQRGEIRADEDSVDRASADLAAVQQQLSPP
jgi:DNA repair exonuclease SbcCD ATPase subunit